MRGEEGRAFRVIKRRGHGRELRRRHHDLLGVTAVPELDDKSLNDRASSAEIEQRIRATTAEFHALQAPQRPTYVLENEIGDRVVFSGIVRPDPLIATIGAMLADAKAQQDYDKSHEPMPR